MIDRLEAFILAERDRYPTRENNLFAIAFGDVRAYRQMPALVHRRLVAAAGAYVTATAEFHSSVEGHSGSLTDHQIELMRRLPDLGLIVRLEIETFYLFAKILLDKVARFLEFHFGQVRSTPLDSHDDLVKGWPAFRGNHGIDAGVEFYEGATSLKRDIADFRDQQIAHHKNPRTLRFFLSDAAGTTRMGLSPIYPTEKDRQEESKATDHLLDAIDRHLENVMDLVLANRARSRLTRAATSETSRPSHRPPPA